jgi:hypothetical protein
MASRLANARRELLHPTIFHSEMRREPLDGELSSAADAGTETVNVEVAPCVPGVTLEGESEHVGIVPVPVTAQVNATGLLKLLPVGGATVIVEVACAPELMVREPVSAFTVKDPLEIVYAALAIALAVRPLAVANALTVAVEVTWNAAEYCDDIVVGAVPSVV